MKNIKAKLRYLIPIIHCLASLLCSGAVFLPTSDRSVVLSYAVRNIISYETERRMTILISLALGCVAVFYIWKIIFDIVEGKISKKTAVIFGTLFVVGAVVLLFTWPDAFLYSEDNLVTYSYAIRFLPEYWHSIYSGCIYAAAMIVFPHAIAISLVQWMCFVIVLGYGFERIGKSPVLKGRGRYVVFLLFLIPDTMMLVVNAYRTEQYCIFCMYFITLVVMDIVDKRYRYGLELVTIMTMAALISVWRTEGIIIGILGFGALLLFVYRFPIKNLIRYCILMVMLFILFSMPQKLGDRQYYGNDYSFINSFVSLQNILNCPDANLSYDGVEADLAAIEVICPINAIRLMNMDGYRSINYQQGRFDINQSGASMEEGKAYKKAYRSLVLHNPGIYLKTQLSMVLKAYGFKDAVYMEKNRDGLERDFDIFEYNAWDTGRDDLFASSFTKSWYENSFRQSFAKAYIGFYEKYMALLKKIKIYPLTLLAESVGLVVILITHLIQFFTKKREDLGFAAISFVLLLQYAAIAMVMPAGVTAYFHTCFYGTLIVEAGLILSLLCKPKEERENK